MRASRRSSPRGPESSASGRTSPRTSADGRFPCLDFRLPGTGAEPARHAGRAVMKRSGRGAPGAGSGIHPRAWTAALALDSSRWRSRRPATRPTAGPARWSSSGSGSPGPFPPRGLFYYEALLARLHRARLAQLPRLPARRVRTLARLRLRLRRHGVADLRDPLPEPRSRRSPCPRLSTIALTASCSSSSSSRGCCTATRRGSCSGRGSRWPSGGRRARPVGPGAGGGDRVRPAARRRDVPPRVRRADPAFRLHRSAAAPPGGAGRGAGRHHRLVRGRAVAAARSRERACGAGQGEPRALLLAGGRGRARERRGTTSGRPGASTRRSSSRTSSASRASRSRSARRVRSRSSGNGTGASATSSSAMAARSTSTSETA